MRKINKKQLGRCFISSLFTIALTLCSITNVSALNKEYTISFKSGSQGLFQNESTNQTYKVEAGKNLAIDSNTIAASLNIKDGYYFSGWNYPVIQENIEKSANYVAQYKRIIDEAVYRVRYVDTYGNELATQKVVTTNVGATISENAINIENYAADAITKTVTAKKEGTEIVFVYISTLDPEIETIIVDEVVVIKRPENNQNEQRPHQGNENQNNNNNNNDNLQNDNENNEENNNDDEVLGDNENQEKDEVLGDFDIYNNMIVIGPLLLTFFIILLIYLKKRKNEKSK